MNIGIDGKWFFKGNPSGRVVIQNLIRELVKADKSTQFYIFLRKEDKTKKFPYQEDNVHLIYIWAGNNLLSNLFVTPYYARKWKIDVFLYQYFSPFIKFSRTITLIHDVIFESNPEYFSFKERTYFKPMRWLARITNRIVTISQNEKERLVKYKYGSPAKISVIYLGVAEKYSEEKDPVAMARVKDKYQLPEKFVLYVGRLNYRKNIHNLIRSFRFVEDKQIKLVLAGGYDWKMFDVQKFISEHDLEDRVQLLGFVDDNDLPYLYSSGNVFCFVSYDEGFGLPPLEAMASGTPVIVADKGSLPEICGEAGAYVDPDQPEMIGKVINQFFSDPVLTAQKKIKGLEQAASFNWQCTAQKYLQLFSQVAEEGK